jgi:hypothetical protein
LVSDTGVVVFEQAESLAKGLQQLPYNLVMEAAVLKQYNCKHKTDLKPADDGNVYLPKGTYRFLWNNKQYSELVLE